MDRQAITDSLYTLVAPSHPNEWEIEEVVDGLEGLSDPECEGLLGQVPAIWPVSHSLCYAFLRQGSGLVSDIPEGLLQEWVRQVLFHYESGGLRSAEAFMAETHSRFLDRQGSSSEVVLEEIRASMQHYICGVSAGSLQIGADVRVWTDTETIYLPQSLDIFPSAAENRLLYKFLVTYQWLLIESGIFTVDPAWQSQSDGDDLLLRIYLFGKVCHSLRATFPGLWRRGAPLLQKRLVDNTDGKGARSCAEEICVQVWSCLLGGGTVSGSPPFAAPAEIELSEFNQFTSEYGGRELGGLDNFHELVLGKLEFAKAHRVISERREQQRRAFIKMLARILPESKAGVKEATDTPEHMTNGEREADAAIAILKQSLLEAVTKKDRPLLKIDNANVTVPDELVRLAQEMMNDLGDIPAGYIQAAAGLAGEGRVAESGSAEGNEILRQERRDGYLYDEWDCRRNGYRRDWCTVIEEELPVTRSNFIPRTLEKYVGLRKRLRAQFELMATVQRFVRRQRDGDDLDLDAIIDAMGDSRAGKATDDRLFVRLQRDERSITTLFLIDMSNSTSGWIGTFIKESLVLLCEAMEKIGDTYGIYGFSGMRRSGCKLYHIKELDEPYDKGVRERISAIGPKDYTRMAPVVRHLTTLLEKADTRSRLLITLSDGKPEDYDGYNGEYAIEDTRKALLEARGKGISPFCITIDKKAHDYLEHMFGAGNYTFINRIESLPARMAQVYRVLTR